MPEPSSNDGSFDPYDEDARFAIHASAAADEPPPDEPDKPDAAGEPNEPNEPIDPYDEDARFAIHTSAAADELPPDEPDESSEPDAAGEPNEPIDPYDEDARFAIHSAAAEGPGDPYDDIEARFAIHCRSAAEQQAATARSAPPPSDDLVVTDLETVDNNEDEFDEERRFATHCTSQILGPSEEEIGQCQMSSLQLRGDQTVEEEAPDEDAEEEEEDDWLRLWRISRAEAAKRPMLCSPPAAEKAVVAPTIAELVAKHACTERQWRNLSRERPASKGPSTALKPSVARRMWIGPNGRVEDPAVAASTEADGAPRVSTAPSAPSPSKGMTNRELSLQSALLARTTRRGSQHGVSETRRAPASPSADADDVAHADAAAAGGEAGAARPGASGGARGAAWALEGDVESASAALMHQSAAMFHKQQLDAAAVLAVTATPSSAHGAAACGPSLDVVLSADDVVCELLGWAGLEASACAAQVCSSWRRLLGQEAVWALLCHRATLSSEDRPRLRLTAAGPPGASAQVAPPPPPPPRGNAGGGGGGAAGGDGGGGAASAPDAWRRRGVALREEHLQRRRRWRRSICAESTLRPHTEIVVALQLHRGLLISASADQTISLSELPSDDEPQRPGSDGNLEQRPWEASQGDYLPQANWMGGSGSRGSAADGAGRSMVLSGHTDQIFGIHAHDEHLASCSADGTVRIWSLSDGQQKRRWRWPAYCVQCDERRCLTGGEGREPIQLYDWRTGDLLAALHDTGASGPAGICTGLHRRGTTVAAANSDRSSPLRTWDLATGELVDRFSLPSFCRGARCLQMHAENMLVAGCGNGWVILADLRTGRFERRLAHPEMVNTLEVRGDILLTGGDDGVVRLTDARTFTTFASHRIGRSIAVARFNDTRLYAGCENGEVRCFDYSWRADKAIGTGEGGLTPQQKQAFAQAITAARRR